MCSSIFGLKTTDNYDQGDLTDIVRSYGGISSSSSSQSQPPFSENPMIFSSAMEEPRTCNFGDPFPNMLDLFSHHDELHNIPCSSSHFNGKNNSGEALINSSSGPGFCGTSSSIVLSQKVPEDDMLIRRSISCKKSIFSNMIQISSAKLHVSPWDSPAALVTAASPAGMCKSSDVVSGSMINGNFSEDCSVDNTGFLISSPQNPDIKRRKSHVKKVVCIPAPAVGNSKQSTGGEVVPCDLWAWRKYGQKPIKGSPYPRGYYRCSSSKGCSARKQVERSRTDPNMLVITYTSDHNHPWPTQRSAPAGSTRTSHPSKNYPSSSSSKNLKSEKNSQKPKEEEDHPSTVDSSNSVKEEIMEDTEKQQPENMNEEEFSDELSYKPYNMMMGCNQYEDLFAEFGEIEVDPFNLVFTGEGFTARNTVGSDSSEVLEPFHVFDWSEMTPPSPTYYLKNATEL